MPTIALVDDDRNILTSVSIALEAEGYRIMTYTDGASALDGFRTSPPDLAILDIKMPRMDGMAATRAIRAIPGPVGVTPIIALTANADPDDAEAYLAAGMNGVVEKPMKPEHLLAALQQALDPGRNAAAA